MWVRLYGGPWHGKEVHAEPTETRITVVFRPPFNVSRMDFPMMPYLPEEQVYVYYVHRYEKKMAFPQRMYEKRIGLIEGTALRPVEYRELATDMEKTTPIFPRKSFLYEFKEAYAQIYYKHTGEFPNDYFWVN